MTNEQYFGLLVTIVLLVLFQGWYYRKAATDVKDAMTILIEGKFALLLEKIEALEKRLEDRGVIGPYHPPTAGPPRKPNV